MAAVVKSPASQRALIALAVIVGLGALCAGLVWASPILVPIALAVFFAFLLSPIVRALQRRRVPRILAVTLVMAIAASAVGGALALVANQMTQLATELPDYSVNIREKVRSFRSMEESKVLAGLRRMADELTREFRGESGIDDTKPAAKSPTKAPPSTTAETPPQPEGAPQPQIVVVEEQGNGWLTSVQAVVGPVLAAFGQLGLAGLLAFFILLKREDIRDRLIGVIGQQRITVTTKALDEAAERISRYLLMQAIINSSYGATLSIGLWIIGVPYALLWGFLAAVLRYIPYIGPWVAAVLPIVLSVAVFPSWWSPLAVIVFFIVLELVSNNVLEPLLYAKSAGVAEVPLLIFAAFWAFVWGPVGLILATPIAVCLVVLGKHIPSLRILNVLLAREPALEMNTRFYQRALARDEDEATRLVEDSLDERSLFQVFAEVLIPSLSFAKRDRARDAISEEDKQFVLDLTRELAEDLTESDEGAAKAAEPKSAVDGDGTAPPRQRVHVLACSARDEADAQALALAAQLIPRDKIEFEVLPPEMLSAEIVAHVEKSRPTVVVIVSLPPGSVAQTRYLSKKLHAKSPELRIVVARWQSPQLPDEDSEPFLTAGADAVTTTIEETIAELLKWQGVQPAEMAEADSAADGKGPQQPVSVPS